MDWFLKNVPKYIIDFLKDIAVERGNGQVVAIFYEFALLQLYRLSGSANFYFGFKKVGTTTCHVFVAPN